MALHFVFGGSNTDKSGWLCRKITKEAWENKLKHYLIIVPEQYTMENQRKYVEESPGKCILNIDILSLMRLGTRVFEETGSRRTILDDLGKTLVVRKVMEELKDSLGFLKRGLTKPGVLDEIKSFLSELMQYDIHSGELEDMALFCENKPLLSGKIKDMQLIYEKFQEKIRDNYLTAEGMYDILEEILEDEADSLKWLKGSIICLDGYTGFTPVQMKVIKQLLNLAEDVYLLIDIDKRGYGDKDSRLFSLAHETIDKMITAAKEAGVEIADPVWPEDKRIESGELLYLEKNIFRYPVIPYRGVKGKSAGVNAKTEDIRVIKAANPEQEMRAAISHIKDLVQNENYNYKDIAVITGDMESYGVKLGNMLAREKIPYFLDRKKPVLGNPFIEYIRSFFRLFSSGFSEEDVAAFIKNPYFSFETDDKDMIKTDDKDMSKTDDKDMSKTDDNKNIFKTDGDKDILENYIRKAGIRSYSQWKKPFTRKLKESDKDRLSGLRTRFYEKMSPYYEMMKKSEKVSDYTECVYNFIVNEKCFDRLMEEKERAEEEKDILRAKEYGQIYTVAIEILDKLMEVLGSEKISLKEYTELFEAGLSGRKIGLIPPQTNSVLIGDLKRSRIGSVKAMFILGVNDGVIPAPEDGGGILTDLEREFIINEAKKENKPYILAPSRRDNALTFQYYLYLNLTKPAKRLYLSYSERNAQGEAKNPSYVIGKLKLIFPEILEINWRDLKNTYAYDILPDGGEEILLEGIREQGNPDIDEKNPYFPLVFRWYADKNKEKIHRLILSAYKPETRGKIGKDAALKLYGRNLYSSVTRFEKYASCAFSHFLYYGLGLREREIFKVQGPDFGSMFHEVMKEFFKNLDKDKLSVDYGSLDLTKEQEKELYRALSKVVPEYISVNEALMEKERNRYIFKRLERMCRRSIWAVCIQLLRGDFYAKAAELPFGPDIEDALSLMQGGTLRIPQKMALRGIIDRLDVCEKDGKLFYRIVDYKTGGQKMSLDKVYYGLEQQLFVYVKAAEEYLRKNGIKEIIPAGAYYYNVKDPVLDEEVKEQISKDYGEGGAKNQNGILASKILSELRMEGYTNLEHSIPEYTDRALKEHNAAALGRSSEIVQVKYKKDGTVDSNSKVMDTEFFRNLTEHVQEKMREQAEEIYNGNTKASPTAIKGEDACQYCPYGDICITGKINEVNLEPLSTEQVKEFVKKEEKPWAQEN